MAGDIRHEVSSFGCCTDAKRLLTVELRRDGKDRWRSELVIRGGEKFAEQRRIKLDGQVREVAWIDKSHFLVVGGNLDLPPSSNERETLYLVALSDKKADVRSLRQYNWIREVVVAPDCQHFVARTREQTSCWKLGGAEPLWTKTGDHLVSFGDRDWVLFHNGPLVA